jgi:acetate kinase
MTRAVLTLNAGSSSLKVALFPEAGDRPLATGIADRIGPQAVLMVTDETGTPLQAQGDLTTHAGAIGAIIDGIRARWPDLDLAAIGHRVVHGGPARRRPEVVTEALLAELVTLSPFAPLHQPHNLAGIRAAMTAFEGVPQVACFDTAFHRSQTRGEDCYALPRALYDEGVRRYGFHGLSYQSVFETLLHLSPKLAAGRVVIAHLGNGASLCAIRNGRSVATTMGFSTLDGLAMGSRCGQIDPGVLLYLIGQKGLSLTELSDVLYKRSGLLGLSGISNDMRALEAAGTPEAAEAIEYFVRRCQRGIAEMAAAAAGIDALVFCGGIGENARKVRAAICAGLGWMGIDADADRNLANATVISPDGAEVAVMVVPTNEELVIAKAARTVVGGSL